MLFFGYIASYLALFILFQTEKNWSYGWRSFFLTCLSYAIVSLKIFKVKLTKKKYMIAKSQADLKTYQVLETDQRDWFPNFGQTHLNIF